MTFVVANEDADQKEVAPNGVQCHECGSTFVGPEVAAHQGEDWNTCPEDFNHAASPVHVTQESLDVGGDEDYLIVQTGTYVYPLEEK